MQYHEICFYFVFGYCLEKQFFHTKLIFFVDFLGYEEIVRILIEKGAKVNAKDRTNHTALILAAEDGNIINLSIDIRSYQ